MNKSGLMRRYLLGTATPAERTTLENDYLPNAESFDELTAAENDLIDSYARGKLSTSEKEAFEERYLTSVQGRSRVEFARALADVAQEAAPSPAPKEVGFLETLLPAFRPLALSASWRFAATCAMVLLVGLVSLRLLHQGGSHGGPSEASKQLDHRGSGQPQPGTESSTGSPQLLAKSEEHPEPDFTAQLEPDVSRAVASAFPTLLVPRHTAWLNLRVVVESPESRPLVAVVQTPEGNEVFRTEHPEVIASQGGKLLHIRIPAAQIAAGDYILDVKSRVAGSESEESVTSCSFRLNYK